MVYLYLLYKNEIKNQIKEGAVFCGSVMYDQMTKGYPG
jgi:hypothetical protein